MAKQILYLGPRLGKYNKLGGVVILFEDIISYSKTEKINHSVIDTNLDNYSNKFFGLVNVFINFFLKLKKASHISLHGTARDFIYIAPIIICFSKICKKKISLRKFAGSFYEIYSNSNFFKKKIIKFVLYNSDYLFFETNLLIKKFKSFNPNTFLWPNSRLKTQLLVSESFNKKFVFVSQVKKTKGIYELIDAASRLDNSFVIDVYGPIFDDEIKLKFSDNSNINYKGILTPQEVINTLVSYDVLILPTFHDGEGYPGIILEAFSVGMPVISTNWNSIPEIVKHNENGLLIPIKDAESLRQAILYYNKSNYLKFRTKVMKSFDQFDSQLVNANYFKKIKFSNNA